MVQYSMSRTLRQDRICGQIATLPDLIEAIQAQFTWNPVSLQAAEEQATRQAQEEAARQAQEEAALQVQEWGP